MDAFFATIPTHFFYIFQILKQNKIEESDLYYTNVTKDAKLIVERIKTLNIFRNVYLLPNISIEYPITFKRCIDISIRKKEVIKLLEDKEYQNVYYDVDGWLYNSIIFTGLKGKTKNFRNIFVENGVNPYIVSYDSKEWYLKLFIQLNGLTCMDGKYIDDRYVFEPNMIEVAQSGTIHKIHKIDKNDESIKRALNDLFDYNECTDLFKNKDIIILEQAPRRKPIDMYSLWKKVGESIDSNRVIIKPHPRQMDSELRNLNYEIYDRYTIPWELYVFNEDISNRTIICIFSTSCITPKLMFDEEPRVIMLYKLLGKDYGFLGEGLKTFVDKIKDSYRVKEKFFIPETWNEFTDYCERYLW